MNKRAYKFLLRGFLVMLPAGVFIGLAESFLWLAGETTPVKTVARDYDREGPPACYLPVLIGQQFNLLHYERVKKMRPELLVLGSSRVTRFREEMFGIDSGFYNSGRTMSCVEDVEQYLEEMPGDYVPEVLLLGIDSWWFKTNLPVAGRFSADIRKDDTLDIPAHFHAYRKIFHLSRRGHLGWGLVRKILARDDEGVKRFGLLAWKSSGMRNDGSNQTFDRSTRPEYHDELPKLIEDIVKSKHPAMLPCAQADDELLRRLRDVLRKLSSKGTLVVGFSPPFASEVRRAFAENPTLYGFYSDYKKKIAELFRKESWDYFDGSDPAIFGMDDRAMKDKDHAQETYHVALLAVMAEDERLREALHLDPGYLKALLDDPETTPWYPPYPERSAAGLVRHVTHRQP